MNFASFSFWWLLLILGTSIFGIRLLGKRLGVWSPSGDRLCLLAISAALFWQVSPLSCLLFVAELLFNYAMVRWMLSLQGRNRQTVAIATIAIDFLILGYFKYLDFFLVDVFRVSSETLASTNWIRPHSGAIPPGISFYTFQMVGFVVDSLRFKQQEDVSLVGYLNFTSFFPQVVAGPIERRADLLPQIQSFQFKLTDENLEIGLRWIVLGLFMKLVLANNAALALNSLDFMQNAWWVWFSAALFGFRIYFDFAGYSFIAYGLARALNVRLTLNFLAPYLAINIQDFWRRWHITLSSWFRDYIYFPLGGSRVQHVAFNLMITFTISGLWHGAGWNYILWGMYHGALLVWHRYIGQWLPLTPAATWVMTQISILLGWLLFSTTNTELLLTKLGIIFSIGQYYFELPTFELATVSLSILHSLVTTLLCLGFLMVEYLGSCQNFESVYDIFLSPQTGAVLLILTIWLSARQSSDFIYFVF